MQKLAATLLFLIATAHFVYAVPAAVETEAQITLAAQQEITRTVTFTLTIAAPLSNDVPEITGRKYSSTVALTVPGLIVNDGGVAVTENNLTDDSALIDKFLEQIEPTVLADIANVEHVKKFGEAATPEGITQYQLYFISSYGSLKSIYYKNSSILSIQKSSDLVSVNSIPAEIKSTSNSSITFVQTNATNGTSVLFSTNDTTQPGDTVYLVDGNATTNSTIESAIIISNDNGTINVSKEVNSTSIVVNKNGTVIGLIPANSTTLLSGASIADVMGQNGIVNDEAASTRLYRDGLNAYKAGDYAVAADNLDSVANNYPNGPAKQYLEDSRFKSLPTKIFNLVKSLILSNLILILSFAVISILAVLLSNTAITIVLAGFLKKPRRRK